MEMNILFAPILFFRGHLSVRPVFALLHIAQMTAITIRVSFATFTYASKKLGAKECCVSTTLIKRCPQGSK